MAEFDLARTEAYLTTARAAADAAAAVHARFFERGTDLRVREKSRSDFVTVVDLEAQEAALRVIREAHPRHDVQAEETAEAPSPGPTSGVTPEGWRPLWVVDPLDGTTNFLHGHPMFASSVAVAVEERVVAGAVTAAATDERWWAADGAGAWYQRGSGDPRPLRVAEPRPLSNALVGTGFPFKALHELPDYLNAFDRILRATAGVRRGGSAALDLCYLAMGRLDAFWERVLSPWDVAAGLVIVREAGGVVRRPDGDFVELSPGPIVAASSLVILEELRTLLSDATETGQR